MAGRLLSSDKTSAASPLQRTVEELVLRGLSDHEEDIDQEEDCAFSVEEGAQGYNQVESAFRALGLSIASIEDYGGYNRCSLLVAGVGVDYDWETGVLHDPARTAYDRIYHVNGREYHKTGGKFEFGINQHDGYKSRRYWDILCPMLTISK